MEARSAAGTCIVMGYIILLDGTVISIEYQYYFRYYQYYVISELCDFSIM